MDDAKNQLIEETKTTLIRMQKFDVKTLPRVKELGTTMSFDAAVPPAEELIRLYNQLPSESLDSLSKNQLTNIKNTANTDFNVMNEVLKFNHSLGADARDNIIKKISQRYDPTFDLLHPMISYSVRRSTDLAKLESDARAKLQTHLLIISKLFQSCWCYTKH